MEHEFRGSSAPLPAVCASRVLLCRIAPVGSFTPMQRTPIASKFCRPKAQFFIHTTLGRFLQDVTYILAGEGIYIRFHLTRCACYRVTRTSSASREEIEDARGAQSLSAFVTARRLSLRAAHGQQPQDRRRSQRWRSAATYHRCCCSAQSLALPPPRPSSSRHRRLPQQPLPQTAPALRAPPCCTRTSMARV
jgi:hypothetical protein